MNNAPLICTRQAVRIIGSDAGLHAGTSGTVAAMFRKDGVRTRNPREAELFSVKAGGRVLSRRFRRDQIVPWRT